MLLVICYSSVVHAQDPPADALAVLLDVRDQIESLDRDHPGAIWPGFAPAGIPALYVLPGEGTLLLGWGGELPESFASVSGVAGAGWRPEAERGAASTGVNLDGRGTAQVVVNELSAPSLLGTSVHEAFHVFQGAERKEGRRFGQGENSFLVTRYPIFDAENETGFALEGRILLAALESRHELESRELASEFIAVRESRQRRLDADLVEFEALAELNEGLAQYAGIRALLILAEDDEDSVEALQAAEEMLGDLDRLIESGDRSFRLRFYHSGPAMALLLDILVEDEWKTRLVEGNLTLQEAVAEYSGYREREMMLSQEAEHRFDAAALAVGAQTMIEALRARLRTRVDSALSQPGVRVVILTDGLGGVGLCGIDPQNLLQVDDGVLFHTRWLRPCAGSALQGEFNTPVVHDRNAGSLEAVIGLPEEVSLTVGGQIVTLGGADSISGATDVEIESPGLTLRLARADIVIDGDVIRLRPLRN
jgi:hypothetical protein